MRSEEPDSEGQCLSTLFPGFPFPLGVEHHAEIGSTNDRALELCSNASLLVPHLVIADRQTAGRGRSSNRWWSTDGALLFSLIIDAANLGIPEPCWPLVSLTAGIAVVRTLEEHLSTAGNHVVGLKWPNDVWLNDRKVCGILVEVPPQRRGRMVIGIGLNVNNSFADAPSELRTIATSMQDESTRPFESSELLANWLRHFQSELTDLANGPDLLIERCRQRCVLAGQLVSLDIGHEVITGTCRGIDDDGALRLLSPAGEQRFLAGTVRRLT